MGLIHVIIFLVGLTVTASNISTFCKLYNMSHRANHAYRTKKYKYKL